MGSTRVGGMVEGPALQAGYKISSWPPVEEGATSSWSNKEDGKKSQAWQRGPIMHRVRNYCEWIPFLYVNSINVPWHRIQISHCLIPLFQKNKSYGVNKPFAYILWCTSSSHMAYFFLLLFFLNTSPFQLELTFYCSVHSKNSSTLDVSPSFHSIWPTYSSWKLEVRYILWKISDTIYLKGLPH